MTSLLITLLGALTILISSVDSVQLELLLKQDISDAMCLARCSAVLEKDGAEEYEYCKHICEMKQGEAGLVNSICSYARFCRPGCRAACREDVRDTEFDGDNRGDVEMEV